ncbi:MAG: transcriptional repressor [Verrucomicrobiales bacterium]|nr:transcriptional repressor [Verrucomicrobiales bacterium]
MKKPTSGHTGAPCACPSHSHSHSHAPSPSPTPRRDPAERLRRESRRITGPRQAILHILQHHPHPLTNKEIFAALRPGECDLATVYRSLHLLEGMGLVTRYDFGDGVARFEMARDEPGHHHHHLVCSQCTAIVEIEDCLAAEWESRIAAQSGFRMVTHKLEFFGICPTCQNLPPTADRPTSRRSATTPTKRAAPKRGPSNSSQVVG